MKKKRAPLRTLLLAVCLSATASLADPQAAPTGPDHLKFDFGPGHPAAGYVRVAPTDLFSKEAGYGFEPGAAVSGIDHGGSDRLTSDFVTSEKPFYFSVRVPEGNYRVTVTLGDVSAPCTTTVKAELRRLMLERVRTEAGEIETASFVVNVRTPLIAGDRQVRLKDRERTTEWGAWDDKLTLEFSDARPCVCGVEIEHADRLPTVFLLGDSTVCDQPSEPWNSWGQMLTRFFKPEVSVANHAESGESIASSLSAGRFEKVFGLMRAGDYLFLQFGHNDMKSREPDALQKYRENLKLLVAETRKRGGIPVLVTAMERKAGIQKETLEQYPATVREVAREEGAALIDLNAMSLVLYRALGGKLDLAFQDGTHHNSYGSYELAKCVVEGIRQSKLDLARFIVDDFEGFDPSKPDPVEAFSIPASGSPLGAPPLGN